MKKPTFFFFLCLFILVIPVAYATKPVPTAQVSLNTEGLQIEYSKTFDHQYNNPLSLNFHTFNTTDGYPINSGVSCDLHLYNSSGERIFVDTQTQTELVYDFKFDITTDNFTNIEQMSYIVNCNNSKQGGFVSAPLDVNVTGQNQDSLYFLMLIFLIPILIGVFSLIGSHRLGEEHDIFKVGLFLFSLTCFFASLWLSHIIVATMYPLFTELVDFIAYVTWIYGLVLAVIIYYFLIYYIKIMFHQAAGRDELT
jgi:hypothetical protein